jgi:formylglycine-generating enzyme required for sulfatase activity
MASNDAQEYNIAAIRQLLLAAFTPKTLRRFCRKHPTFRPILDEFSPDHGLSDMVDELITYCENFLLFPELLAELKQHNPRQYARFFEPEQAKAEPAPTTPQILTITSPIRLDLVRIPAGEFEMGSVVARDPDTEDDELPPHTVHVPDFYIAKYPMTNRQYQAFVLATGHPEPDHWKKTRKGRLRGKDNHPVVNVSWNDAVAFCDWLSREAKQPFRLPTEAEWEKAARGSDGRIYPWGDDPPDKDRCNFGQSRYRGDVTTIGRYSPQGDSPYGCTDMAGNVHEWCQSLYKPYPYQADDGREDLKAFGWQVLRGGSWCAKAPLVRCASRYCLGRNHRFPDNGFRVCIAAR